VQNVVEAVRWFRAAAVQGDPDAQYSLGIMYGSGFGVAQGDMNANMWFNIATENGAAGANEFLDRVTERMTDTNVSEAQRARVCTESGYQDRD